MPMRPQHAGGQVLGERVLEGDVPGHEPHAVVAGQVAEAGLVAGVGLEQAVVDVGDGRARDVLVETARRSRGSGSSPQHAAEALDGPDAGQGGDGGLGAPRGG